MSDLNPFATDQIIRDCGRFRELLDSPVLGVVVRMTEQTFYAQMRVAKTPDDLLAAQANANALDAVLVQLRSLLSAGEREAIERAKADEMDARLPNHKDD